nr:immunoglobulin light chain junction region [Macaca mulatta]MOW64620.1 immunoglobulin light chain junction region [Macaca mulatta]MOW73241.1 immunoglobulin light chain junction region [Macaca mulatta]MOW74297.1 immunoglobulin light chain junction region [Macaca mulatta]
CQQGYSIPYSF